MTSLSWLTAEEVGPRHTWFHYLEVAVPHNIDSTKNEGLLFMVGGEQQQPPQQKNDQMSYVAAISRTVCSCLYMIPNQPVVFNSDPLKMSRTEDEILAFGWAKFMNTSDTQWITRLPMVKAAVKAMDTIQHFSATLNIKIDQFTVAGASKRGWTAWLTAAVDIKRVKTVVPMVIQVVKTRDVLAHTYDSLCEWPIAMKDYVAAGITGLLNSVAFTKLTNIIDPFVYRDRLANVNKYMVNALGDQFFMPDNSQFSYPYLPGGDEHKHLRYVPNTDHSMAGSDALEATAAFYFGSVHSVELPNYNFTNEYTEDGMHLVVKVTNGKKPTSVLLWQTTNQNGRDFRIETVGKSFVSTPLQQDNANELQWSVFVKNPPKGYTCFTIELTYVGYFEDIQPLIPQLKFTTSAYIVPNVLPCSYNKLKQNNP